MKKMLESLDVVHTHSILLEKKISNLISKFKHIAIIAILLLLCLFSNKVEARGEVPEDLIQAKETAMNEIALGANDGITLTRTYSYNNGNPQIKLSWSEVEGASKYNVYQTKEGESEKLIATIQGTEVTLNKVNAEIKDDEPPTIPLVNATTKADGTGNNITITPSTDKGTTYRHKVKTEIEMTKLAYVAKVGSYINYPISLSTINANFSNVVQEQKAANSNGPLVRSSIKQENSQWRVLYNDGNIVTIMSTNNLCNTLAAGEQHGYYHWSFRGASDGWGFEQGLHAIAQCFINYTYAQSGRAISRSDLPYTAIITERQWNGRYSENQLGTIQNDSTGMFYANTPYFIANHYNSPDLVYVVRGNSVNGANCYGGASQATWAGIRAAVTLKANVYKTGGTGSSTLPYEIGTNQKEIYESNTVSTTVTSGIKGYQYAVTTSEKHTFTNEEIVSIDQIPTYISGEEQMVQYLHIRAIDNAGNTSATQDILLQVPAKITLKSDYQYGMNYVPLSWTNNDKRSGYVYRLYQKEEGVDNVFKLISTNNSVETVVRNENVTVRYTTPGTYTWTVPEGVTQVKVTIAGAGGGGRTEEIVETLDIMTMEPQVHIIIKVVMVEEEPCY